MILMTQKSHFKMLKVPKIRNAKYREWVASLPCALCCFIGASQSAHIHLRGHKGKGIKESDDQIIPLCHAGANDCHGKIDRYEIDIDRLTVIKKSRMAYEFWKRKHKNHAKALLKL